MTDSIDKPKFGAALRIFGEGIDFEEIVRVLGIEPSHTHRTGDMGMGGVPFTNDMWLLSPPLDPHAPLDEHLRWLERVLSPHYQFLFSLREKATVDIYCNATYYCEQSSVTLSDEALRLFIELHLPLGISLLFLPDEDSDSTHSKR